MVVPLLDLRAQYRAIKDEIDGAVAEVFETQQFIGGPNVEGFEKAIAHYLGMDHTVGVASGTDALLLLLKAAGIGPGDEVITTTFSFFATAGAIANAGARPVFVDIDPATFNIDATQIEASITEKSKAIVPVHLFGQCADMDPIMALAHKNDLWVVEDAAQALGARYKGRPACALGHAAAVSFYPTKNLGAAGDGGMVVTPNDRLAVQVRLLRHHGQDTTYYHPVLGTNSRLDALQAAVLGVKLKHLDAWNEKRRANAAYYSSQFAELPEVITPAEKPGNFHVYHQYVIRIPNRDAARERLTRKGVGCSVFYPIPLHRQKCFAPFIRDRADFPEASKACREVLAIPIYPELTPEQQDEVVAAVKEHLEDVQAVV